MDGTANTLRCADVAYEVHLDVAAVAILIHGGCFFHIAGCFGRLSLVSRESQAARDTGGKLRAFRYS